MGTTIQIRLAWSEGDLMDRLGVQRTFRKSSWSLQLLTPMAILSITAAMTAANSQAGMENPFLTIVGSSLTIHTSCKDTSVTSMLRYARLCIRSSISTNISTKALTVARSRSKLISLNTTFRPATAARQKVYSASLSFLPMVYSLRLSTFQSIWRMNIV